MRYTVIRQTCTPVGAHDTAVDISTQIKK